MSHPGPQGHTRQGYPAQIKIGTIVMADDIPYSNILLEVGKCVKS